LTDCNCQLIRLYHYRWHKWFCVVKADVERTSEGLLDARQGKELYVAAPRQRLSDAEREPSLGLAVDAFSGEIVGLGYPTEHILDRMSPARTP
jgi:GntR family transcriptional regulator